MFCKNCYSSKLIRCGFVKSSQRYECNRCGYKSVHYIENLELIQENVRLAKQKQSAQDLNRIERKSFREFARIENAVGKYNKELVKIFKDNNLSKLTKKHKSKNSAVGVI